MLTQAPPACEKVPAVIVDGVRVSVENTAVSIYGAKPKVVPTSRNAAKPGACVAGMISFVGQPTWSLTLVLPEQVAPAMAQAFVGMEIPFDSPDMADVIGELTNVLAGEVVSQLEQRGIKSQMSLPQTVRGHDVEILHTTDTNAARLDFEGPHGRFWLDLVAPSRSSFRQPGS